ncbi:MAG: hypothetical protein SFV19_07225 [Rhodospirillaceae bacterium]|nr:hypothetical protein [Rhodospirillaceae bacterium]
MAERPTPEPITVDVESLRQARTERILERETTKVADFSDKLGRLKEFNVLSMFARSKSKDN